jgi:hypothetical protein
LVTVDACHADVRSDIEFSLLVEERHDVLLDNVGSGTPHLVDLVSLDYLFNFLYGLDHFYASASIGVLSGFNQPSISFFRLGYMFELLVLLLFFLLFEIFRSLVEFFLES